jgi:hypothetical protein
LHHPIELAVVPAEDGFKVVVRNQPLKLTYDIGLGLTRPTIGEAEKDARRLATFYAKPQEAIPLPHRGTIPLLVGSGLHE